MRLAIITLFAAIFVGSAFFATADEQSEVVVLTKDNFDTSIATGPWLVEFYAPWCGHCKKLAPTWEELALKAKEHNIKVGKVDSTIEQDISNRFDIRGYPTIKLIRDGKAYSYKGQRTVEDFLTFAKEGYATADSVPLPSAGQAGGDADKKEALPEMKTENPNSNVILLSDQNFEALTARGEWLVEFYAPWCGHCKRLAPIWEELATETKGRIHVAKVDCTAETETARRFGISGYPTVKYIKNGRMREYKGDRTVQAFAQFAASSDDTNTTPIPDKPSKVSQFFDTYIAPFEQVAKQHVFMTVAFVFVLGFLSGCIVGVGSTPSPRVVVPSQPRPVGTPIALIASGNSTTAPATTASSTSSSQDGKKEGKKQQ